MRRNYTTVLQGLLMLLIAGVISTGITACKDNISSSETEREPAATEIPLEELEVDPETQLPAYVKLHISKLNAAKAKSGGSLFPSQGSASTGQMLNATVSSQGIGTLGGQHSWAYASNSQGQIVGESSTGSGQLHAFVWDPDNGMTDIGTLGGNNSYARDINDAGQVVGYSQKSNGRIRAFVWDPVNGMTELPTLGGNYSYGFAINEQGQVAGYSDYIPGTFHGFVWDAQNGMTDIGTLGGIHSYAYDINDSGQVVGYSYNQWGREKPFLWEEGSGMTDLGGLGGTGSQAYGINNNGQVVGQALPPTGPYHAFLWDATNGMVDLGTLGGSYSQAFDINDDGVIVGYSENANAEEQAFVWEAENGMAEMSDANYSGTMARGLNEDGLVAGYGMIGTQAFEAMRWTVEFETEIIDEIAPLIGYTQELETIWPPNHKMVLAVSTIAAYDEVDGPLVPEIIVESNQSVNGKGDGNTSPDWEIVDNGNGSFDVWLRAERAGCENGKGNEGKGGNGNKDDKCGNSDGRIYTVTITAADAAGNTAEEVLTVTVPHDQGKKGGNGNAIPTGAPAVNRYDR